MIASLCAVILVPQNLNRTLGARLIGFVVILDSAQHIIN